MKVVSDTALNIINAAYYDKPLIFIETRKLPQPRIQIFRYLLLEAVRWRLSETQRMNQVIWA